MSRKSILRNLASTICVLLIPIQSVSRTISDVQIEAVGASKYPDREFVEKCSKFRPTLAQITHYFDNAYPVEADFAALERSTPCYATGSLSFNDGASGEWILYSGGTASFTFQRGDYVTFYYPSNSWNDPTNCTYGSDEKKRC